MNSDDKLSLDEAIRQAQQFGGDTSGFAAPPLNAPKSLYEDEASMIADFNRFFIQVLIGNMPSVIWERNDKYIIFNYENFHKQFSYVQVIHVDLFSEKKKAEVTIKATKYWLDSPRKRSSDGIKFWPSTTIIDPEDPENKIFNQWKDWPIKPVENKEKWAIIYQYLFEVLCNSDQEKIDHLLDFTAHLRQKPEQKPSFGIALRGEEEGTGKSTFVDEMRKIVGKDNAFKTADPEQLFGTNNPGMDGCLLLHLEEVEWAKYNRYANKLRDLFTTPTININDKYEKQFVQNNFTRIFITGNAEHIMHVSRTGRRLSIFDVSAAKANDTEYYATVRETFNTGGREAAAFELFHRDITNFNPFKPLHTKEMDEQKELSLGPVAQFWLDEWLEENKLPYDEEIKTLDGHVVAYKVVVEKLVWFFNDWQKRRGERALSPKAFGRQFRKIVPEMRPAPDVKTTPAGINKQMNCFEIKDLKECRDHFVKYQGWKHKTWNNAEQFEMLYVDKALWYRDW
jgi:hypothetical protein